MASVLVFLLLGTVIGELKILQNRSKAAFEAKGRLYTTGKVIQRYLSLIYIHSSQYIAIGEANDKSSTLYYTIK